MPPKSRKGRAGSTDDETDSVTRSDVRSREGSASEKGKRRSKGGAPVPVTFSGGGGGGGGEKREKREKRKAPGDVRGPAVEGGSSSRPLSGGGGAAGGAGGVAAPPRPLALARPHKRGARAAGAASAGGGESARRDDDESVADVPPRVPAAAAAAPRAYEAVGLKPVDVSVPGVLYCLVDVAEEYQEGRTVKRAIVRMEQVASMCNALATWCDAEQASPCQQEGRAVDFAVLDRGAVRVVGYIGTARAIMACARELVGDRAPPGKLADAKWRQGIFAVVSPPGVEAAGDDDGTGAASAVLHVLFVGGPDAYGYSEERSSRFDLDTVAFVRHMIQLCGRDGRALNVLIDGAPRRAARAACHIWRGCESV